MFKHNFTSLIPILVYRQYDEGLECYRHALIAEKLYVIFLLTEVSNIILIELLQRPF